jgi:hypothetical protein
MIIVFDCSDGATHSPSRQWLILLLFGSDVISLAIFLLTENALEGKIWLNCIWFGYYFG